MFLRACSKSWLTKKRVRACKFNMTMRAQSLVSAQAPFEAEVSRLEATIAHEAERVLAGKLVSEGDASFAAFNEAAERFERAVIGPKNIPLREEPHRNQCSNTAFRLAAAVRGTRTKDLNRPGRYRHTGSLEETHMVLEQI